MSRLEPYRIEPLIRVSMHSTRKSASKTARSPSGVNSTSVTVNEPPDASQKRPMAPTFAHAFSQPESPARSTS